MRPLPQQALLKPLQLLVLQVLLHMQLHLSRFTCQASVPSPQVLVTVVTAQLLQSDAGAGIFRVCFHPNVEHERVHLCVHCH